MITYASQQGTPWSGFNGFGQGEVQSLMPDGTVATAQIDSDGYTVGWYRTQADGTTALYDASGNPAGATAGWAPTSEDGVGAFFSSLSSLVSGLFRSTATPPAGAIPRAPGVGGLGMGTLLLIGGAVYFLTARSGRKARR